MLKIACADCLGLSAAMLVQFTFGICITDQNHEKFTQNPFILGFKVVWGNRCWYCCKAAVVAAVITYQWQFWWRVDWVRRCAGSHAKHVSLVLT